MTGIPCAMLTDAEITELRAAVSRNHLGRMFTRPPARTRYVDGPLDGITHIGEPNSGAIIGWCTVTKTGPVSAYYDLVTEGEVRFRGFERPGGCAYPSHYGK